MIKFVKILAIVMILAIVLSVAACSKSQNAAIAAKPRKLFLKKTRSMAKKSKFAIRATVCINCLKERQINRRDSMRLKKKPFVFLC